MCAFSWVTHLWWAQCVYKKEDLQICLCTHWSMHIDACMHRGVHANIHTHTHLFLLHVLIISIYALVTCTSKAKLMAVCLLWEVVKAWMKHLHQQFPQIGQLYMTSSLISWGHIFQSNTDSTCCVCLRVRFSLMWTVQFSMFPYQLVRPHPALWLKW